MVENNDNGWEYCEVCHVHLRSRDLLQAHQQGVQHMRRAFRAGGVPQGQRFRCPVCLVDFDCQNNLHNHMRGDGHGHIRRMGENNDGHNDVGF